jgi:hypothetical protein
LVVERGLGVPSVFEFCQQQFVNIHRKVTRRMMRGDPR